MIDLKNAPIFDSLVISVTSNCNLNCIYCQTGPYMNELKTKIMPIDLIYKLLNELSFLSNKNGIKNIELCFSGGEPLIAGINYFENILFFQKKLKEDFCVKFSNIIQTNGTLLNAKWISFIKENKISISISLDGPEKIQNEQRPFLNGKKSFSKVMQNIELLKKHNIDFGIISVITEQNALNVELIVKYILSLQPRLIAFLPCVDRGPVISNDTYSIFLTRAFDLWVNPQINKNSIPIRTFKNITLQLLGVPTKVACDYLGICPRHPNVSPDGKVSVCDQYVGKNQGYLGNLNSESIEEILNSKRANDFLSKSRKLNNKCYECKFLKLCNGGCIYRREKNNGLDYLCDSRKVLFNHIYNKLDQLITKMGGETKNN